MEAISQKPTEAERDEARMLLGWLIYAKRSLKWHEVQVLKSIDLDHQTIDFEHRRFRVDPRDLCESLVELQEDGTVELVHYTARQ
jgi:hypothetical protein